MLRDPPKVRVRKVKNGFFNVIETYYDNILYCTDSYFCRKDSMANLYDEFGTELPVRMSKVKIFTKKTKLIRRFEDETAVAIWAIVYGFSVLFPLFGAYSGLISREHSLYSFIPIIFGFGLYLIVMHPKWIMLITHRKKEIEVEVDD